MIPSNFHQRKKAADAWDAFWVKAEAMLQLQFTIQADFDCAEDEMVAKMTPYRMRNVVRTFGSFVDALATTMRELAWDISLLFEKPLNPFLKDKANERGATAMYRVKTSYRIVGELLPQSRLNRIEDTFWNQLHSALEVRNRIVHPRSLEDLEVTTPEVQIMSDLTSQIMTDMVGVFTLLRMQAQESAWKMGAQRVRDGGKIHRNDLCVCGSGKKYKHCCGRNVE